MNINSLETDLKKVISGEVRFDAGSRALYATDGSNYRQPPIGVVIPKTEKDIINAVETCRKHGAPILSRGCGTSLAGQCCNVAVVIDVSKYYNNIQSFDTSEKLIRVEPGIVLDHMRQRTEKRGLTFGPDPATHNHCTIGGMLGNNSCGVHSVMSSNYGYGARMSDNTHSLTVLTYDGNIFDVGATTEQELENIIKAGGPKGLIYKKLRDLRDKYQDLIRSRYPNIPRRVSGYNLDELLPEKCFNVARALVGSEGTCVTILSAEVKLLPLPKARSLLVLGYPEIWEAGNHIPEIMKHKPIGVEGLDNLLIGYNKLKGMNTDDLTLLPKGKGWLLVEFGGDSKDETDEMAHQLMKQLKKDKIPPEIKLFDDPEQEKMLWEIRESGLGATAFIPGHPDSWPGWEDSAVPPDSVGDYLKDLRNLFNKYGYNPSLYGHLGQGCIHCRVDFDLVTREGLLKYKSFTEEAADMVVRYGGSLSGEHGDGQSRADLLVRMFGPELLEAFHEFKRIWDPENRMNPGKVIDAYGQLENLRLGVTYNPKDDPTHFKFPNDKGSFARAALRCVGVGKCRRTEGGTMCPSYMITHEEQHCTRGRTHLLFEMFNGGIITDRWNDESINEALSLCLSCKGCKNDCPVNVDVATYKAEFLSHYYKNRLHPPSHYAFGQIFRWAELASHMPGFANFLTHAPVISSIAKLIIQAAPERDLPKFASLPFRSWMMKNKRTNIDPDAPKVILWADTFNNYFLPETLWAGMKVLEDAGFHVMIPRDKLCCGRPLFDFGMLNLAEKLLKRILLTLQDQIRAGIPVVGLEPSCVAVFRDELCELFPNDHDAKKLKENTFTLAEFLQQKAPWYKIPQLKQKAIVQGHCHHKAIMGMDSEEKIMEKMGLDYTILDSGCCGMAGSFGYQKGEAYRISVAEAERVLLPAVRNAGRNTLILADGFSCREQIKQETKIKAMHLAEVLQYAITQRVMEPEKQLVEAL